MIGEDIENLQKLYLDINKEDIEKAAETILQAKKVCVIGVGPSKAIAEYFSWHLMILGINVVAIQESGYAMYEKIAYASKGDCAVCFSIPQFLKEEVKMMEYFKVQETKSILITSKPFSSLSIHADIIFKVNIKSTAFINSLILPMEVASMILLSIFNSNKEKYMEYLKKTMK